MRTKTYNILFYKWNEVTFDDGAMVLEEMGHHVVVSEQPFQIYDHDEAFIEGITQQIKAHQIDLIFTFNYFPDLSRVAERMGIPYISWCFDSPLRTLDSVTLSNDCNRVFLFDHGSYEKYVKQGIQTVRYLPLACNVDRVQKLLTEQLGDGKRGYEHEITFLGTMYENGGFLDQIAYLPPYIKGYIDAVMEAQMPIFGMDLVEYLMRQDICDQVFETVSMDLGPDYRKESRAILISLIQKQITMTERRRLLTVLGENYPVDHYAEKQSENLPVNYKGYARYTLDMPRIFATSKINLNISLRSILTGIPLRVIDILGAGGFCISNYQAELPWYFEDGKSIVWYESYEDLVDKINFYLAHDAKREEIARAGHEIVKKNFTYEILFDKIFSEV